MKPLKILAVCSLLGLLAAPAHGAMTMPTMPAHARKPMATPKSTPVAFYAQKNLTSDVPGKAAVTDRHLSNSWGMAFAPDTAIWISDNNTGVSTLYNGNGQITPLVVTIPLPAGKKGTSSPTGLAFNPNFQNEFGGGVFLFSTEDGTLSQWALADGTKAVLAVDNSASGAVYKGLAMGTNASGDFLFATNIRAGTIDVFDKNFKQQTVPGPTIPGGFVDAAIPAGFAPFGIANLDGDLYVSYALQNAAKDGDQKGPGNGFVDIFDTSGNLLTHLISQGRLNSPWGMALTPSNFGPLSNTLLVGNLGDGAINAFDPKSGVFIGQPKNSKGMPIVIDGLWALVFGDGSSDRPTNTLFFTSGPNNQKHGLFGRLDLHQPVGTKKPPKMGGGCKGCHS